MLQTNKSTAGERITSQFESTTSNTGISYWMAYTQSNCVHKNKTSLVCSPRIHKDCGYEMCVNCGTEFEHHFSPSPEYISQMKALLQSR